MHLVQNLNQTSKRSLHNVGACLKKTEMILKLSKSNPRKLQVFFPVQLQHAPDGEVTTLYAALVNDLFVLWLCACVESAGSGG